MIWTNTKFTGHYPVGTAAAVSAQSSEEAASFLNAALRKQGLKGDAKWEDMEPFFPGAGNEVRILCNGDY